MNKLQFWILSINHFIDTTRKKHRHPGTFGKLSVPHYITKGTELTIRIDGHEFKYKQE